MDILGSGTRRGTTLMNHYISNVHEVDGRHVSSFNKQNDGINTDITRSLLMVVLRSKVIR